MSQEEIDVLINWIRVCLVIASIGATSFPVIYSFSPWQSTLTGRLLMFQAIAFALIIDVTLLFQFWIPEDVMTIFWINAVMLLLVALSTSALSAMVIRMNYVRRRKRKRIEENSHE